MNKTFVCIYPRRTALKIFLMRTAFSARIEYLLLSAVEHYSNYFAGRSSFCLLGRLLHELLHVRQLNDP
jgi:hypothetical protein